MTLKTYQAKYEATLIRESSFRRYSTILSRIVDFMGNRRPEDVFRKDVALYRDERMREVAPGTVNLELTTGAAFYAWMAEHEYIAENHNPFKKTKKVKDSDSSRHAISLEDQLALRAAATTPIEKAVFEFSRMTPLRGSDLSRLTKEKFDLDDKSIRIMQQKTGKFVLLPIAETDIEYIKTLPPGPIFHWCAHWKHPYQKLSTVFHDLAKKAGVKACLHEMRHTFATEALRNGVDIRTVQALMGHSSITTTAKYLTPGDTKAAREFLERRARALSYRASSSPLAVSAV